MTNDIPQQAFPEVSDDLARSHMSELFRRIGDSSLRELRQYVRLEISGLVDPPGEFERVDDEVIVELRTSVLGLCDQFNFPNPMGIADRTKFDAELGTLLFEKIDVPELLAARVGMWRYLSAVVLPEVPLWRYGQATLDGVNPERYLGHPDRDVLRSRWWRAWALGPNLSTVPRENTPLGEDELTSIMERPTIGYSRDLARAVRDCIWRWEPTTQRLGLNRPMFTRALTRLLILELNSFDYGGATMDQLEEALDELAERALAIAPTAKKSQ